MRLPVAACVVLLAGCATTGVPAITSQENSLLSAGFVVRPADTPARQNALNKLPNRIVRRTVGTNVSYLYGDPVVCHCLYVGDRAAFVRYQSASRVANRAADADATELNPLEYEIGGF